MTENSSSRVWPFVRNTVLLGAAGGLAALNWQIWNSPADISPLTAKDVAAAGAGNGSGAATAPLQTTVAAVYRDTLARPLFRPDRRPFVAEAEPPPVPEPEPAAEPAPPVEAAAPPEGLRLIGILSDGDNSRVLVKTAQAPAAVWIELGEEIEGWRLADVGASTAAFALDGQSIEVELYPEPSAASNDATKP